MCVQVCPTGIDIRDGLQYECIGCALCIDACDSVMEKMNYPIGLISYTTEKNLEGKKSKILRPRTLGYAIALLGMIIAFSVKLGLRSEVQVDVIRDRGALFQTNARGFVENSYTLQVMNMSNQTRTFDISVSGPDSIELTSKKQVTLSPSELLSLPAVVEVNPEKMTERNYDINFRVQAVGEADVAAESESRFLGPGPNRF
jgi:cytochrome c oxidase accessory protein FixG